MKVLKLSHILLIINLIILALPITGIALFNLYDSNLVRETENELITQGVIISNVFKRSLIEQNPDVDFNNYGVAQEEKYWIKEDPSLGKWRPLPASLDLFSDEVLEQAPPPIPVDIKPDKLALDLGPRFDDLLQETQLTTLSGIRILDYNGIIIASTGWTKLLALTNQNDVKQALKGVTTKVIRRKSPQEDSFFSPISRSSNIRVHVTHPIVINKRVIGAVHILRTPPNTFQHLYQNRKMYLSFLVLVMLGILAITIFSAYTIAMPIRALVTQAKNATDGRWLKLTPLKSPITAEFELLSNTIVQMSNKQMDRAEHIKKFASYVSHEFKTPITSINGAVDILSDHHGELSKKESCRFYQIISDNCSRMNLLMAQLTELAKADNMKVSSKKNDLITILSKQIKHYESTFSAIHFDVDGNEFSIHMDDELITSVFVNLFENVIQHGGDEITIKLIKLKNNIVLSFSDNGKGITEQNAKRIFEPFFTTAKQSGGTGLGLAILKTLLKAHGGDIQLEPSTTGCHFRITFPLLNDSNKGAQ
ncbi:HAMP domain-containing sensor histidine kinase [uncultured Psychrosphaera sp.]|uniref:sensor histidine kinase n=1 Tax=uncultured Psychrosphaera sp. TaxID=1403522 RepID=UPI0030F7C102